MKPNLEPSSIPPLTVGFLKSLAPLLKEEMQGFAMSVGTFVILKRYRRADWSLGCANGDTVAREREGVCLALDL